MMLRLLPCLVLLIPAAASADAIMPFEGDCFPGSRRGVSNHRESCIPIECTSDASCGAGATCQTLCVCRAEREFRSNGRVVFSEPQRRVVEIGFCDAQGACAEGDVGERRQCEPTADTPAFDRTTHRWTGETHVAAPEPEPGASSRQTSSSEGSSGGCAVGAPGSPGAGLALLALLGLLRWRRR